jgi:hypothetical protein
MTMARSHLVDVSVTRWHHCTNRCVRRALLLAEGPLDRKEWIELRLKDLDQTADHTGRLHRDDVAMISAELTGILNGLVSRARRWEARLEKLILRRLLGQFFALRQISRYRPSDRR